MKQAQIIVWHPYPDEKPQIDENLVCKDFYVLLYSKLSNSYLQVSMRYWNNSKEFRDEFGHIDNKYWKVKAFAELPAPFDPSATTFNFQTALLLMKEGKTCYCYSDECDYRFNPVFAVLERYDVPDCPIGCGSGWNTAYLGLDEIENDWEVVE